MTTSTAAKSKTEAKWTERVRAWRASGETAQEFAQRHGYAASTPHVVALEPVDMRFGFGRLLG